MRALRKDEHIDQVLRTEFRGNTLFSDVILEPVSLPELALEEIDLRTDFFGQSVAAPILINAMTGGTERSLEINRNLATLARDFGLPIQVGSQTIALEDPTTVDSFRIVREVVGPQGLVMSNLYAGSTVDEVGRAMDMLDAQAIGIHLNPSQELTQAEGGRDFRGWQENLEKICRAFPGQVLVKEVGFGMSRRDGKKLAKLPLAYIDVSGAGGTNFVEVEDGRRMERDFTEFYDWGIPTAKAIWNIRTECPDKKILASGGIATASDILRALILGSQMTGISGELLRYLLYGGLDYARAYIQGLLENIRMGMLLLGCRTIADLSQVPYLIVGRLRELIEAEEENHGRRVK